jgi:6-phosphogluconolactonase
VSAARLVVTDDTRSLAAAVADELVRRLQVTGDHHLVLTGGGVGTLVLAHLVERAHAVDWQRVHLWWGDERFLPLGHPERNETAAREVFVGHVPIPSDQVHPMPPDVGQGVDAAAQAYADELAAASPDGFVPPFEILFLGMGPEGHIASLFPGAPALDAATSVVAVHDSPKPPATRVSLTLPAIRSARDVWVVAAGESKAAAAAAAMSPDESPLRIPAAGARGRKSTVFWLDRPAAELLA